MSRPLRSLQPEAVGNPAELAAGIETCDRAQGLAAINTPDRELVIWRRLLPAGLASWLERMEPSRLPDLRILVRRGDLRAALEPHLDACDMPAGDMRDLLIADVGDLVSTFSGITGTGLVDVRLERVTNDACWKFHRDCVEARLLTTYRGPATEWVHPAQAARALQEQKEFKGPLEQLRLHDVAFFKGSCAEPGSGIVHRSPPVAGTGQTRLLLCLNKPSASSPDPWPQTARN